MAEIAIDFAVSAFANGLSKILIEEYEVLGGGAVRHVEWIERELRSMQGLLEHVEQSTYDEQEQQALDEWAETLKKIARDAEDVIETFLIKSVKRRRSGVLYWIDQHKVGKELGKIRKRMSDISEIRNRMIGVSVESPREASLSSSSPTNTAIEKLDHILSQNLITDDEVMEMVEKVKDDLGHLQNIASNLRTTVERENLWLEEVKEVCDYTADVAGNFIARRKKWFKKHQFKKQLKHVRTQIGDVLYRCLTYEVGGQLVDKEVGDMNQTTRSTTVPVQDLSIETLIILQIPFLVYYPLILFVSNAGPQYVFFLVLFDIFKFTGKKALRRTKSKPKSIQTQDKKGSRKRMKEVLRQLQIFTVYVLIYLLFFLLSQFLPVEATFLLSLSTSLYEVINWTVNLRRSMKKKLKCTQRYLALMRVFLNDTESVEGLNERQKAWVEQLRAVSQKGQSFIDTVAANPKGKFAKDINGLLKEILDISGRKAIYSIANFQQGTPELVVPLSLGSISIQESEFVVEHDDNFGNATPAQAPASSSYQPVTGVKEKVQSIRGEKELMDALLLDADGMGELDGRSRIWVEQMRDISIDVQSVINKYEAKLKDKPTLIYIFKYWTRHVISNEIDGIRDKIEDASRRRKEYDGIRPLFTTRNENVAQHASYTTLLDDESSWELFTSHLKVNIPKSETELIKVGKEIVMKCGGLQPQILKMSDLLSHKDVTLEEWSSVLGGQHLNEDQMQNWLETLDKINTNLPSYLRRCLFYFLLFPADFGIPMRRLVVLWVAENLLPRAEDDRMPLELVAEKYVTELIERNMVQVAKRKRNGKVKTCRLPSALRQLWLTKAKESRFLQGRRSATNSNADPEKSIIRRVTDHLHKDDIWNDHIHGDRTDSTSLRTYYKDVLSFLSFDTQEGSKPGQQVGNFLKGCISSDCFLLLRVLDLERVYKPKLPERIARLTRLRYLGLRWTYLESLPSSISKLLKLQTLDLKHTYIHTLPSSIWMMELRHLFLSETFHSRFPPQQKDHFSRIRFLLPQLKDHFLYDLQTLWGLFVDEETPVQNGLDELVNITKLGLACQQMSLQEEAMTKQLEAVADWIAKLEHLQSLRLKSRDEEGKPWILPLKSFQNNVNLTDLYLLGSLSSSSIVSQFPKSLVELTLSHSKLREDPMKLLKHFSELRILCLLTDSYMGQTMVCESQSFPKLHVLKVWWLEQLEEWKIEQEALPCLRQLEIRSCPNLQMLPDGLNHVNTLLELKLTNMPMEMGSDMHNILPNCQVVPHNFQ